VTPADGTPPEAPGATGLEAGGPPAPARTAPRDLAEGTRVREALAAILDDLGFETASLFAPAGSSWQLLDRVGPVRPWHGVLDPGLLEGAARPAQYADVRTLPGVGDRLASLGCASLAVLPLPHGLALVLDAARPPLGGGWVERARPFLELVEALGGPSWPAPGPLRAHAELAALGRLFSACQDLLGRSDPSLEGLLEAARDSLQAHELYLVTDRPAGADVHAPAGAPWRVPLRLAHLPAGPSGQVAAEARSTLARALGLSSPAVGVGVGRDRPSLELLVAGWREGPSLSEASMAIAARTVSTVRAAVLARSRAVNAIVDRERARMAYALHDDLTQTVTAAVLELEGLRRRIERDPAEALATLDRSKREVRRALAELRGMLFDLSAGEEEPEGAAGLARHVEDLVRRWRLPARVSVRGDLSKVPGRVRSVAYAVVREALANAARHAGAASVSVELSAAGPELLVSVTDTGRGFSPEEVVSRGGHHLGLAALRRRVAQLGGDLEVQSRPGRGTRLLARLPVEGATP
jgi:signal transduction histidine kinase